MRTRTARASRLLFIMGILFFMPAAYPQAGKSEFVAPKIDVLSCKIEADLTPDEHQLSAAATIKFAPLESTDLVHFELSENLWVGKVIDTEGIELEFRQSEIAPGNLNIRFREPLSVGEEVSIRIEYEGGFDRDRFSRMYSKDNSSAYIGMEGTYLMYSAKWFPVYGFLESRMPGTLEVTVPLGMTVIGPGIQLPVITRGISETFGWNAKAPILPGSFVAGRYFRKRITIQNFAIECFARQSNLDPIMKSAEAAAKILEYYHEAYGPSASGNSYRLVEVDDFLQLQPGMLGTIFVTRSELARSSPPVRELARRIAYQWWQETTGARSASDLWLVDGMAYFSAAQYIESAEGSEAYKDEINKLAVLALKFESRSAVRKGLALGYRTDRYESVVAGKGAWVLKMLRGIIGETKFDRLIRTYFESSTGKAGDSAEFQKLAEKEYGRELNWFFTEWIDDIGVPELQTDYVIFKTSSGFRVSGTVTQDRDLFRMPVEIAVVSRDENVIRSVELSGKSASFDIETIAMPDTVILDPNNNLLRDSRELQTAVQISLGNDLKQNQDYVGAIRAYEGAIRLSPNRSLAHFRLAEVFYEQFNLQSSANSFRDALNGDMDPHWIEVWCYIYLGKIYDILGQRQRAMAEYTKAINTKDDTDGAQAEAQKWLETPFTRERTTMRAE
jgi:aminopeptidase N